MDYVELNAFVKKYTQYKTGGQAKQLIRSGVVTVNGVVETANRKTLVEGDRVCVRQQQFIVQKKDCQMKK
ncbi:MAG: RNA-binding S4 domain-containing protein [Candidatus Woesearchaeota archaeon]